jgi:hypothetical protein
VNRFVLYIPRVAYDRSNGYRSYVIHPPSSNTSAHTDTNPPGPILTIISLIVLAGGIVLQFFVILSGIGVGVPVDLVYFLQSTTNGITGARNPSRWTFFAVCGADGKYNANCGKVVPALPFDPVRNFGTDNNIPAAFIGTHKFYYLSRFMFAFYLIALFFAVIAFFTSVLALCTRLGAYLTGLNTALALFFQLLAAALMTYGPPSCLLSTTY